jgi:hypothetical protein
MMNGFAKSKRVLEDNSTGLSHPKRYLEHDVAGVNDFDVDKRSRKSLANASVTLPQVLERMQVARVFRMSKRR